MNIKRNKKFDNFEFADYVFENFENENYIDCSLGVNPFFKKNGIHKFYLKNNYPDNDYPKLKQALCKKFKTISLQNIAFGSGTIGILKQLFSILIEEKSIVLGISPQFSRIKSEIEFIGAYYETVPLEEKNNFKFICDDFIKKISNKYRLIYIDNPNNPTGQVIDLKNIKRIINEASKYKIPVIIDEAYGDYFEDENSAINIINDYANLFVCRSASKMYGMADCRVGYLISSTENIAFYNKLSTPFPFSTNSSNIFSEVILKYNKKRDIKKISRIKKTLIKLLSKKYNVLETDEFTPIFCIRCKNENLNLRKELIMKYAMLTESCQMFDGLGKNYVRIRIPQNYKKLIKNIKTLDKCK